MRGTGWVWGSAIALLAGAWPVEGEIVLRHRVVQAAVAGSDATAGLVSPQALPGKWRRMLEFRTPPDLALRRSLEARGLQILAYLPQTGLYVSADREPDLQGLPLVAVHRMESTDKRSAGLGARSRSGARDPRPREAESWIVEFAGDIPPDVRLSLIERAGLHRLEHPDLNVVHLLVRGPAWAAAQLAELDEVSYVFAASQDLVAGAPLIGCVGGATEAGTVGQMTAHVGEGWDGPGLGSARLTYSIEALTAKVGPEIARDAIRKALDTWSAAARLEFVEAGSGGDARHLRVLFGRGAHGDSYPFDGPGRVLAHTFYPAPPNPEPIAGDLHLDEDENWQIGADIDLFSVVLHELGHALGLGHSDDPGAVMYPYYRRVTALSAEDIGAIRQLYAAAEDPVQPFRIRLLYPESAGASTEASLVAGGSVEGAVPPVVLHWENSAGWEGQGVATQATWVAGPLPLSLGGNSILFTAIDGTGQRSTATLQRSRIGAPEPAPPPLQLTILPPGPVSGGFAAIRGTVSGIPVAPLVNWRGGGIGGSASVAPAGESLWNWSARVGAFAEGTTAIQVTAAAGGVEASGSVSVTVPGPPAPGPEPKPGPVPVVRLTTPATTFLMTTQSAIGVRGTVQSPAPVATVRWECSCGRSGTAQGSSTWTVPAVPLPAGLSTLRFIARDTAGREGDTTLRVLRQSN